MKFTAAFAILGAAACVSSATAQSSDEGKPVRKSLYINPETNVPLHKSRHRSQLDTFSDVYPSVSPNQEILDSFVNGDAEDEDGFESAIDSDATSLQRSSWSFHGRKPPPPEHTDMTFMANAGRPYGRVPRKLPPPPDSDDESEASSHNSIQNSNVFYRTDENGNHIMAVPADENGRFVMPYRKNPNYDETKSKVDYDALFAQPETPDTFAHRTRRLFKGKKAAAAPKKETTPQETSQVSNIDDIQCSKIVSYDGTPESTRKLNECRLAKLNLTRNKHNKQYDDYLLSGSKGFGGNGRSKITSQEFFFPKLPVAYSDMTPLETEVYQDLQIYRAAKASFGSTLFKHLPKIYVGDSEQLYKWVLDKGIAAPTYSADYQDHHIVDPIFGHLPAISLNNKNHLSKKLQREYLCKESLISMGVTDQKILERINIGNYCEKAVVVSIAQKEHISANQASVLVDEIAKVNHVSRDEVIYQNVQTMLF